MITDIHPECTRECTHQLVPDLGGRIVQRNISHDRAASEAILRTKYPGLRLDYLGTAPGEPEWKHTWRLGGKPWRSLPSTAGIKVEGKKTVREIKYEHRPDVWTGNGKPGPVDFSRVADAVEQAYPAPSLTSVMPYGKPASAPAASLYALALAHGWQGEITYARGCPPHATHGRPTAERFSEAVRLHRGDQRAVAVRMGGSWASLWTWSASQFFTRHATLEVFKEALR